MGIDASKIPFLMHRVELKVMLEFVLCVRACEVPNAPCGVEREVQTLCLTGDPFRS